MATKPRLLVAIPAPRLPEGLEETSVQLFYSLPSPASFIPPEAVPQSTPQ